jgi:outer membrane lipoprotein carrier protein
MKKFLSILLAGVSFAQFSLACPPAATTVSPRPAEAAKAKPVAANPNTAAASAKKTAAKANATATATIPAVAKPEAQTASAKPAPSPASGVTQQDGRAEKTLNEMSKKYQAMKAYSASFSQTMENPNANIKETMKGDITVMGNKFRLSMDGHEIINNGSTIWTYMKNENEVNISDYDPSDEEITPNQIYNMYKKGYKYNFVKEEKQGGQVYEIIELTPEDRSNPVFKVELTINQKDKTLKSWKMFRNNGNRYTYLITKFSPNPPVAAADFSFDKSKYKGVKVIDLR